MNNRLDERDTGLCLSKLRLWIGVVYSVPYMAYLKYNCTVPALALTLEYFLKDAPHKD